MNNKIILLKILKEDKNQSLIETYDKERFYIKKEDTKKMGLQVYPDKRYYKIEQGDWKQTTKKPHYNITNHEQHKIQRIGTDKQMKINNMYFSWEEAKQHGLVSFPKEYIQEKKEAQKLTKYEQEKHEDLQDLKRQEQYQRQNRNTVGNSILSQQTKKVSNFLTIDKYLTDKKENFLTLALKEVKKTKNEIKNPFKEYNENIIKICQKLNRTDLKPVIKTAYRLKSCLYPTEEEKYWTKETHQKINVFYDIMQYKLDKIKKNTNTPKIMGVFISNFSYLAEDKEIQQHFEQIGPVKNVVIKRDDINPKFNKGWGFVNFQNPRDEERAIIELNGKQFQNRTIYVKETRKKEHR